MGGTLTLWLRALLQCSAVQSVDALCRGGISQCLCSWDSGAALFFLCRQHLDLPVRRVQVCEATVLSVSRLQSLPLPVRVCVTRFSFVGKMRGASCNLDPRADLLVRVWLPALGASCCWHASQHDSPVMRVDTTGPTPSPYYGGIRGALCRIEQCGQLCKTGREMSPLCALVSAALASRTKGRLCEDGRNSFLPLLLAPPCPSPIKCAQSCRPPLSALSLVRR